MKNVYHRFQVTDKKDIGPQEAFEIAKDIVDDISSTISDEWPKRSQLGLVEITKQNGIRVYHFEVIEL
jgi:hypothetical protein